jgi:hypothetical protein
MAASYALAVLGIAGCSGVGTQIGDSPSRDTGASAEAAVRATPVVVGRAARAFAQELLAGLRLAGFEPYLDQHDIAPGEDWEARLGRLIEAADTVVFVISPDAVASERCAWEVERTVELKKRLLPIVWRRVDEAQVPARLKQLNYIFFDKPVMSMPALTALSTALKTDLGWIREHTRIGEAALRWAGRERNVALLFRGDELAAAKAWLASPPQYAPEPTILHHEFIKAGEDAEAAREGAERQRLDQMAAAQGERERALNDLAAAVRRGQRALVGATGLFACIVLGAFGWYQQAHLKEQLRWYTTGRPYMMANFAPHVLSIDSERDLKPGVTFRECAEHCPEMVVVPKGDFEIGSPTTEAGRYGNEEPQIKITFNRPFAVSKYPITFEEWDACVTKGPCRADSVRRPRHRSWPVGT